MISVSIKTQLAGNSGVRALVAARVYPDWARMQDKIYPLIVYEISGVQVLRGMDGPIGLESAVVTIAAVGKTYDEAVKVSDAVQDALDCQLGTWAGVVVQGCFLQDDGITDEVFTATNTEQITAYIRKLTFDITYEH